jgi:hypothetical protein
MEESMNIRALHSKAMELAGMADLEKIRSNKAESGSSYEQSYSFEYEAAMSAYKNKAGEPSVSVLLRSAASLAMSCKKFREAEKLIALALNGEPPLEIADELRNLPGNVNFFRKQISETVCETNEENISGNDTAAKERNDSIMGVLKAADANTNVVAIVSDNHMVKLKVPGGLSDIVKNYWNKKVSVDYYRKNKRDNLLVNMERII